MATPSKSKTKAVTPSKGKTPAKAKTPAAKKAKATPAKSKVKASPAKSKVKATPSKSKVKATPSKSKVKATPAKSKAKATPAKPKATPAKAKVKAATPSKTKSAAPTRGTGAGSGQSGAKRKRDESPAPLKHKKTNFLDTIKGDFKKVEFVLKKIEEKAKAEAEGVEHEIEVTAAEIKEHGPVVLEWIESWKDKKPIHFNPNPDAFKQFEKQAPKPFEEVADQFQPGDILLWGGTGSAFSDEIKLGQDSIWSHCAMVLCEVPEDRLRPGVRKDWVFVEASTNDKEIKDWLTGEYKMGGVQTITMTEKMNSGWYNYCAVRHRKKPLTQEEIEIIFDVTKEATKSKYCHDWNIEFRAVTLPMTNAKISWKAAIKPDGTGIFCSQLVGEILKRLGTVPEEYSSAIYVPADFTHYVAKQMAKEPRFDSAVVHPTYNVNDDYKVEQFIKVPPPAHKLWYDPLVEYSIYAWHWLTGRTIKS